MQVVVVPNVIRIGTTAMLSRFAKRERIPREGGRTEQENNMEQLVDLGLFLGSVGVFLGGIGVLPGGVGLESQVVRHPMREDARNLDLALDARPLLLLPIQLNDRPENIQAPALADRRGDEEEGLSNSRRVPSRPLTVVTGSGKTRE